MDSVPKLRTLDELVTLRQTLRGRQTLVWTNGCFDLLHVGHVRSLREAKSLGDILVVGINSDRSVRAIKGALRPVVDELDRAETIGALEAVDFVTIFDDADPVRVLSILRPDIHCKGADYANGAKPVPEAEIVHAYGGRICFLPLHEGRSTTGLISRIAAAHAQEIHA